MSSHSWKSPNKILLNSLVMLSEGVYTREGIRDGERSRRMAAGSLCPVVAPKSPLSSRWPDGPLPGPARLGSGSHTRFDDVFQAQGGTNRMRRSPQEGTAASCCSICMLGAGDSTVTQWLGRSFVLLQRQLPALARGLSAGCVKTCCRSPQHCDTSQ